MPKESASYNCLSLILLDSVIRANDKYYPQTLWEECKYKIKKNKKYIFINDHLQSDNESESD